MPITHRAVPFATASVLLLLLAACTPAPGADPGSDPSGGATGAADSASGSTDCLVDRTWVLNTDDLAAQLAANITANGLTVTQSTADGRQTVEFASDGTATSSVDVTYTIAVDTGDGLVMTIVQTHSGTPGGQWAWLGDSSTLTFSNWDNGGYSVQNTILIDGVAVDAPIDIPSDTLSGTDMETSCEGNTLSTHVAVSPFTQHWIAEG